MYNQESTKNYSGFVASPLNNVYIYNSISIYSKIGANSKPYTNKDTGTNKKQILQNCYTNIDKTLDGSTVETELLDDSGNLNVTKFNEVANKSIGQLITDDSGNLDYLPSVLYWKRHTDKPWELCFVIMEIATLLILEVQEVADIIQIIQITNNYAMIHKLLIMEVQEVVYTI